MNIHDLKRRFLEYLEVERGRSLKTVENYDRYLTRFLDFSKAKSAPDITDAAVRNFRLFLNRQPGAVREGGRTDTLKKKTQNYHLIALRAFLKYLGKIGVRSLPPERIELAKVGEREFDLISTAELNRLLGAPEGESIKSLRDRAILELLFSTGLRVSELCNLPRDIDLSGDSISVRGKGEKVRVVFISKAAKDALAAYQKKRADTGEAMFVQVSRNAGQQEDLRLTPRSVERIVKHYAVKAGISKKVTPHVIRHLFATDLLEGGADLRSVQTLLGHAHIGTTQVYTHVTDMHLRDVHKAFHGKRRRVS